jgi:hypothetical protein
MHYTLQERKDALAYAMSALVSAIEANGEGEYGRNLRKNLKVLAEIKCDLVKQEEMRATVKAICG